MSQADAVFTEVLDLSIDTASFVDGLAKLESAYTEFLARIASAGEGVNLGGVAAASLTQLNESVAQLQTSFTEFDSEVTSAFTDVDSQLKSLQTSVERTAQAAIKAKATIAEGQGAGVAGAGGGVPVSPVGGGLRGVLGEISAAKTGMARLIGQVIEFRLLWGAISEVIELVVRVIESPFEVIKTGFTYLNELQDQAASMQGSIAANAAYSADLGKNFEMAGHAAQQVAIEMQNLGVKMGVPAQELEHIFTDVLESGGLKFAGTMQGVVNLTELFVLAMQKTSTSVEVQRRIMMDIPKLLDGANVSGSRILTTLGLTNEQWQKIRTEALAHGDLVEKLSGLMAPYLTVVEQADQRQSRLIESIKLQSSIIAGAIALPLWQQFTGILQDVKNFLSGNQDALVGMGEKAVHIVENFGTMLLDVAKLVTGFTSASDALQKLVTLTNNLALASDKVLAVWAKVSGLMDHLQNGAAHLPGLFGPVQPSAAEIDAMVNPMGLALQKALDKISGQAIVTAKTAIADVMSGVTDILDTPVGSKKDTPDPTAEKAAAKAREEAFQTLQESFRTELEKTKQTFISTEADIKARQEVGTLSVHEATQQRVTAIQTELDAIQKLVQAYTQLAAKSGAKPTEIQKFDTTLTDTANAAQSTATTQTSSALAQDQSNAEHITQAHEERLRQMALTHQREMVAIYKQEASEGIISKTDLFDKEQALAQQEHIAVMAALSAELQNAGSNEAAISKITDAKLAEDRRYTDSLSGSAEQRKAIGDKEVADAANLQSRILELTIKKGALDDKLNSKTGVDDAATMKAEQELAAIEVKRAQDAVNASTRSLAAAAGTTKEAEALERLLKDQIDLDNAKMKQASLPTGNTGASTDPMVDFGKLLTEPFASFKQTGAELAITMGSFAKSASSLVGAISSGYQSGGIGGAIGGGLSSIGSTIGQLSSAFKSAPIVGAIISGVGEMFSFIGDLFTAAARKIAADIQKATTALMNQYSNGQATLVQTISGLEQERQDAINRLSNKKGGQDQLNQLLPQLDNQIAQLKLQQTQVKLTFEQSLAVLQTHSQTIGGILSTWQQINKQVTDYLNAGGDAAKAAQFLSLNLQQVLQTTSDSLLSAEDSAIQDAMKLNGLLLQRVDLAKQFAQQEFALKNQDALERMANPAVNAAIQYQRQKAANDAQLTALDQQISLYTSRVDMEKQVFNLAQSTADLQAQANQLNLTALAQTIQGWKDLQKIVASITQNSAGLYSLNPNLFNAPTATGTTNSKTINVGTVNVITQATDAPSIAAALAKELALVGSNGGNTRYA
jgi:hypothetical protein